MTENAPVILSDAEKKHLLQQEILSRNGGLVSIVGSACDAALMALECLVTLSDNVSQAQSVDDIKAAFVPVHDMLKELSDALKSGAVTLPHHVKPQGAALSDIKTRASTVSAILSNQEQS